MSEITNLKEELLKTLSFYEAMSLEFIFLDLDQTFLMNNSQLNQEDLQLALDELVKEKKLKLITKDQSQKWIRVYPRKTLLKRILSLFR